MADPLSVASGVLTLAVFAFQSSKSLHELVSSFQSNQRTVRDLKEELSALSEVLSSLQDTATNQNADFASLQIPLHRCGQACADFQVVITKCTAHSHGSKTSFRDWAKLTYMGNDIIGFKNMLAGYKSTILIALADANMRSSAVTVTFLEEFKEAIANTTSDLNEHLQAIDTKLQAISLQSSTEVDENAAERQQMQAEMESAQQCLAICTQVSTHIDNAWSRVFEEPSQGSGAQYKHSGPESPSRARSVTAESFEACKTTLADRTVWLQKHVQDIDKRLKSLPAKRSLSPNRGAAEQEEIQKELESIKQCLAVCADAAKQVDQNRSNVFEDVNMADDGRQVIVSTIGDLVSAKRVTAGARSMQLMGQMSDDTLQQVSLSHKPATIEGIREDKQEPRAEFVKRYGDGVKLTSQGRKSG